MDPSRRAFSHTTGKAIRADSHESNASPSCISMPASTYAYSYISSTDSSGSSSPTAAGLEADSTELACDSGDPFGWWMMTSPGKNRQSQVVFT
eukprot:SAG11_NODE_821_length_7010_cov_9.308783_4_plen_93_part_00